MRELKGEAVEEAPSVALDLPVPMSIPRSYIGDENLRMEIYRKLAAAEAPREELVAELARPLRRAAGRGAGAARRGGAQAAGRGAARAGDLGRRRAG